MLSLQLESSHANDTNEFSIGTAAVVVSGRAL